MSERLPPLTALRAFDAAARHMSFAKAADELNVTPAALSFQIKSLEEHFGAPLFRRLNRAVELTDAGQVLARGTAPAFADLAQAWRAAQRVQDTSVLNVTSGPAFVAKWLAPRMYAFAQAHPEIELRFVASLRLMDLARDGVDVAIRFGRGTDERLYSRSLGEEWLTPCMTPDLAKRFPTPASLLDAPLIIDGSIDFLRPRSDWAAWFRAAGVDGDVPGGVHFSQADHAIDAAVSGGGVVLARGTLAAHDLKAGRLVAPFKPAITTDAHFRFLCPEGQQDRPAIAAFHAWTTAENSALQDLKHAHDLIPLNRG
ncbi:transcriptional regulator GcvA [Pseudaestuariivita atlantica]|uniref:Transcriptional regulator n=1 Tax=Pseudaestuariivita atlantica TaxID=1317121 RepID=A0A0L1JRQ6_9RHOB|nr:transcriptional regulator GcvA [Pseudaestuariivita atlantica]KNG94083.1 transcriptional regulator [Pseudaestuariivita atlantica]